MSELLNSVTTTEEYVEYDRSYGGTYDNTFKGVPSVSFHMHRVTVRVRDDKLMAAESLPSATEPFTQHKVYDLFNPQTGAIISPSAFTAEQFFAMYYSVMRRAIIDRDNAAALANG
jgi:hypothetical protein